MSLQTLFQLEVFSSSLDLTVGFIDEQEDVSASISHTHQITGASVA